jgi:type 2A phosphatase activator TIP41
MIPKAGAHFKFDGRFLHGVFDEFASGDVDASAARVTLLANIWFDHVPVGVERLDESLAATLGDDESCVANEAATELTTRTIASSEFATTPMKDVAFGPSGGEYELVGAEFPFDELRESAKGEEGEERVHLFFITNEAGVRIKLRDDDEPASKRVKM